MTDRPILFSAPMVRALLDGRKTQTRRVLNRARVFATPETRAFTLTGDDLARALQGASGFRHMHSDGWVWEADAFEWQAPATRTGWLAHIGYAPGDRLWVREAFSYDDLDIDRDGTLRPWYWADGNIADADQGSGNFTKPKPSIHMPRWASRLTLTVTDVRVERLNDCSEADAKAEGCNPAPITMRNDYLSTPETYQAGYRTLWNSINGPGAWESNPWVVAVTFTVEQRNIDA